MNEKATGHTAPAQAVPRRRPPRRWLLLTGVTLAWSAAGIRAAGTPPTQEQARAQVERMLVASPWRISPGARDGRIRYRFEFTDGRSWVWPRTAEQSVAMLESGVELTVCADCGDEPAAAADTLEHYRAPNHWIDSDDPDILRFARAHSGIGRVDVRMRRLVNAVQRHMSAGIDFRAYATASEALAARSGDCTEYAVLLAASARAAGIPVRLAYGIAYASRFTGRAHVFSPHVWVQAWDGRRWASYDAGLGRFDAGHIALHVGDGSADGLERVSRAIMALRLVDAAEIRKAAGMNVNDAARDP